MAQSLLTSNGAQSPKPSKYKPIWTDRFFTGLFTNRSPFRSPLSTLYADGYNLGKSDTLIDGVNVELTPRLTLARRPGQTAFSTANTTIANTFYSFHQTDGSIMIVEDTATDVNTVTPTAITSIYTKPATAKQSNFCALGPNLYWGDTTNAQAYETETALQRQMGINTPFRAPSISSILGSTTNPLTGSSYILSGITFGSGGFVSTTTSIPNYSNWSLECWFSGGATGCIASFENSQTGVSTSVFYQLFLDSSSQLSATVRNSAGIDVAIETNYPITDAQLHHLCVTFSFTSSVTNIIPTSAGSSQNANPGTNSNAGFTYLNTPTLSSEAAPSQCTMTFYVDGKLVASPVPVAPITSLATGNGFWRFGKSSGAGTIYSGFLSLLSITDVTLPGPADLFQTLNLQDASQPVVDNSLYISRVLNSRAKYFWEFQEPTGTTAIDSTGSGNTGTYHTTNLVQTRSMIYQKYIASTAYTADQIIIDSNGNLQTCIGPGTSGTSAPTWSTGSQQTTIDGSVIWECFGPAALDGSSAQYIYYYSFVNKQGHYSSVSPASVLVGNASGQAPVILGYASLDTQVTQIGIFRTVAGGSTPFLLAVIEAPPAHVPTWSFIDNIPDSNLNILLAGPQASSNNPPPYGINNLVFHMNRLWGSVGNLLYCSGGPDTIVGNGNEAWPPANSWSYPAPITRCVPSSQGLIVLTVSGGYMHAGGPSIAQFYSQPLFPRVGLASWNALDAKGNEVVLFTSDKQLISIDLSSNTVSDLGYPVLDILSHFDPTKVYVARHHSGLDNAVYVSNGSTGWLRCVPQQAPDYQITGPVWSPFAGIQF